MRFLLTLVLVATCVGSRQGVVGAAIASSPEPATQQRMQAALTNLEFLCREHLRIPPEPLPWIIFYDETNAWHVEADANLLRNAKRSGAELLFAGRPRAILHTPNTNGVWIPAQRYLPAGTSAPPHTFAMPYAEGQKCFFIAALPSFVRSRAGADLSVNWEAFSLGSVAHELTHTR